MATIQLADHDAGCVLQRLVIVQIVETNLLTATLISG